VEKTLRKQRIDAESGTCYYLVNLLTFFAQSENLYEYTPDGWRIRPLADYFADARQAANREQRHNLLRRIGDVALFVAGVFAESLQRKPVAIDYYFSMGGRAYSALAAESVPRQQLALQGVFTELSANFVRFVDVLTAVTRVQKKAPDLQHLYANFLCEGDRQTQRDLLSLGAISTPSQPHRKH